MASDQRLKEYFNQPFTPSNISTGAGLETDAALRIANAIEYSAAQLGIIARAVERIELQLQAQALKAR
jgi:galactokinase